MSSFYDDASLVVIPSGYKTSKVYAEKPTDGSGDLAFTRTGDTATRVNSAGLIEKVRTNINTYSEQLDNAAWTKQSTTVTANATTAPNNTLTADKLIATATTAFHGIFNVNATLSSLHTFSFYAKKAEYNFVTALDQFSGTFLASFNLDTGVVSSGSGASIQSVGNGWYRCAISFDGAASAVVATLAPSPSSASVNYLGDGTSGIFVWGVQLETGDIATDYIPTTTAAVSVGPVANVPRLDYLGSTCPRLLLEPQRTNLVTNSERFTSWLDAGGTVTSNTSISPDGYMNADTLTGARYQSGFASNQYTVSCFAKKVDGDGMFVLRLDAPTLFSAQFNLNTGTIVSTSAGYTSTITNYGNGWYRCTLTTPVSTTIANFVLISATGASASTYIWGAQCEAGAYATSLIPTLAASATRGDELLTKTSISSLIGQVEGTLLLEFDFVVGEQANYGIIYDAGFTSYIYVNQQTTGNIVGQIQPFGIAFSTSKTNGKYRCAIAYKSGDSAFFVNGVQIGSTNTTTFTLSTMDRFTFLNSDNTKAIHQALLFKTRLTNSELAELTSL
jgi:hypothetical protein